MRKKHNMILKIANYKKHYDTRQAQRRNNGFSLVELVIVVAILGILAGSAMSMLASGPDKRLKGAARDLWSDIRFARMEALKRKVDVGFQVRHTNNVLVPGGRAGSYIIFLDDGAGGGVGTDGDGILNGTEGAAANRIKTVTMPEDVSLISETIPTATDSFSFNSTGRLNSVSVGEIRMRNGRKFYRIVLSQAGSCIIESSGDGNNWNEN